MTVCSKIKGKPTGNILINSARLLLVPTSEWRSTLVGSFLYMQRWQLQSWRSQSAVWCISFINNIIGDINQSATALLFLLFLPCTLLLFLGQSHTHAWLHLCINDNSTYSFSWLLLLNNDLGCLFLLPWLLFSLFDGLKRFLGVDGSPEACLLNLLILHIHFYI